MQMSAIFSGIGGPKVGGINLITGGGSKATDPLGLFKDKPVPDMPPPPPGPQPWVAPKDVASSSGSSGANAAAAANGFGALPNPLDDKNTPKQLTGQ